jgi:hypothetical protein
VKTLVCTSLSAALCFLTVTPTQAQNYGVYEAFGPRGSAAVAVADVRIPLGGKKAGKPTYGLSMQVGPLAPAPDAPGWRPQTRVADVRFTPQGLEQARLGGVNFAQGGQIAPGGLRMNDEIGGKPAWLYWLFIGLAVAAGICLAVDDCWDDSENGSSPQTPGTPGD